MCEIVIFVFSMRERKKNKLETNRPTHRSTITRLSFFSLYFFLLSLNNRHQPSFSLFLFSFSLANEYLIHSYVLFKLESIFASSFESMEQLVNFIIRPPRYPIFRIPFQIKSFPFLFISLNSQLGFNLRLIYCSFRIFSLVLSFVIDFIFM